MASSMIKNTVVNNLTSTATDKPLAAAQGKALNDKIANVREIHNIVATSLDTIKSNLLSLAAATANETNVAIKIYCQYANDPCFEINRTYMGYLCVIENAVFSANIVSNMGKLVTIGHHNGTWNFYKIN